MVHLVNNALRTKNMVELLQAMGIPLDNTQVACKDERVIFNPGTINEGENLAANLQALLQKDTVKPALRRITLTELMADEIAQATCNESAKTEIHKKSLLALLSVFQNAGLDYALDEQQDYLHIQLPSPIYAPLFNTLNYKYLSVDGEKLKFNIKEFLKAHQQELILIDGKSPLLFAHSDFFENKKVFYAEKRVSEDTIEVTPYFFVPDALSPPAYHFVLDTSISMKGERLTTMQHSVSEFADVLFQFQPDAVINITQFNSETKKVGMGSYRKADFAQLSNEIHQLKADGLTRLFGTVSEQLSKLSQSTQHNNILLFTDGENSVGEDEKEIDALEKIVKSIEETSSLIPARNKFFILSYGVKQPDVLHQMVKVFGSHVLKTDTSDFQKALSEKGKLQEWAAARELFTCRLEVTDSSGLGAQTQEYVRSYDMSGQFVALKPKQYKDGETLHLTITDGNGKTLLDDKKQPAKKQMGTHLLPGSAKAATQHGVFSVQGTNTKEENVSVLTPTFI